METQEKVRCAWCGKDPTYVSYHDKEWGVPVHDDRKHFEFLVLESAQAGLSWLTVLRKRENYRKAMDNFDVEKVSMYDEHKLQELLANPGIIRNNLKLKATISNAKCFLKVAEEFGSFDNYIWSFTENKTIKNSFTSMSQLPSRTELSDRISKDLIGRGFKFVGSTIVYANLQAIGIINDHVTDCFRYNEV
ncbi:MAG: DNA-3-methyladenine glycosylase I [Bacteroidales bacterium]|nr:DNA-3-methyladenine glycosylase I [Bacteroidales bacterium]MCB8999875.1 DNA-3-methyladenine glycosylase I [Bacteroidales bacterium]